jgi:ATP/ADP translocase
MKEASAASGEMVSQATTAWDFTDPVIFLGAFTVIFCIGMIVLLYRWISKKMVEDEANETNE